MSEEKTEIEVFTLRSFDKVYKRLPEKEQNIVDDVIDELIDNPEIGERKKRDLSYLRVYKFDMAGRQTLLGYHFKEQKLQLFMMQLGPHENFYKDAKNRDKANLKIIK